MSQRPVVLCAGAHEILEDRLGNLSTVLGLAISRLLRTPADPERRELLVMLRRKAGALEEIHKGLTPCDRCPGCKGHTVEVMA